MSYRSAPSLLRIVPAPVSDRLRRKIDPLRERDRLRVHVAAPRTRTLPGRHPPRVHSDRVPPAKPHPPRIAPGDAAVRTWRFQLPPWLHSPTTMPRPVPGDVLH